MPMTNDYHFNSIQKQSYFKASPRVATLNLIRQFAESYGIINDAHFATYNLN